MDCVKKPLNSKIRPKLLIVKKYLNTKILPNWMLLIIVIVLLLLTAFGQKITYSPQLENDWSAIDAVGGGASAVISGVAIWFAVFVPKCIAQKQNKIALFEKRFSSYSGFLKYTSFITLPNTTQLRLICGKNGISSCEKDGDNRKFCRFMQLYQY